VSKRIFVLGTGGWGTALAVLATQSGHRVTLWGRRSELVETLRSTRVNERYLPGVALPDALQFAWGDDAPFREADAFIVAIPTQHLRTVLTPLGSRMGATKPVLSCSKGIENGSLERASEVIREILGRAPVAVLSGPSHAEEVVRGLPATVVVAAKDEELARWWQSAMTLGTFRLYTSADPIGVELGGALKNVIAIAAGMGDGLKLGDNAKSALLTRGIVEMARLGVKLGAQRETFFGLSGIGDLITTCFSPHGRNLRVGREVGAGRKLRQVLDGMVMVAEGVATCRAAHDLGLQHKLDLPITEEVYQVLYQDREPKVGVRNLMTRQPRSEME
jgi:glycerol-3-phosphate dehydrogenase (NAD(P)+)